MLVDGGAEVALSSGLLGGCSYDTTGGLRNIVYGVDAVGLYIYKLGGRRTGL